MRRKAQTLRNVQGAAFAGFSDAQAVQRLQGVPVEFHSGVDQTFGLHGKFLDLGIVGRRYKQAVLAPEFIQDGDSQPHSLGRIGAGA
ncbi:hypothetical protein D3C81_1806110 [compost metagenome]